MAAHAGATEVLRVDPPWSLELRAKAWPVGTAWIRLTTHPAPEGRTEICLAERADGGPGRHLPLAAQRVALAPRNNESLRRLAHLVEGRHG
ncbi:hypothetical protein ACTD5D_17860 [Nocardia takedensis]|uniref:hypothetical protein n=1 Tax=Nocardia takedensis TaxID=259390 RepID=UPI003F76F11E